MNRLLMNRPPTALVLSLCLLPLLAACGTRQSDAAVLAAAGGGPVTITGGQGGTSTTGGTDSTGSITPGSNPSATAGSPSTGVGGVTPSGSTPGTTTGGPAGTVSGGASNGGTSNGGTSNGSTPTGTTVAGGGPTILLGNVGQYSGPIGSSLAGAQPALQMWAKWTNDHGGILGRQVSVVSANDQGDPSTNKTLIQKQVEENKVVAFVGNQVPLSVQGGLSYLESNSIPVVGGDGSTPSWAQSPMLFSQGESVRNIVASLASVTVKAGLKKAAIIYCLESSGNCAVANTELTTDGVAAKVGLTITNSEQVSLTQPDFSQQCIRSQAAGAQALLIFGDSNTVGRVADSCAAQNYKPLFVTGSLAVTNGLADNSNLEGLLAPQPWFGWPLVNAATADYRNAIVRYAPSLEGSSATASAWSAGELLKKAIEAAKPAAGTAITSADVLRGLYTIRGQDVGGLTPTLTFNKGKPASSANCAFTIVIKGGKFVETDGGTPSCLPENFG